MRQNSSYKPEVTVNKGKQQITKRKDKIIYKGEQAKNRNNQGGRKRNARRRLQAQHKHACTTHQKERGKDRTDWTERRLITRCSCGAFLEEHALTRLTPAERTRRTPHAPPQQKTDSKEATRAKTKTTRTETSHATKRKKKDDLLTSRRSNGNSRDRPGTGKATQHNPYSFRYNQGSCNKRRPEPIHKT